MLGNYKMYRGIFVRSLHLQFYRLDANFIRVIVEKDCIKRTNESTCNYFVINLP